MLVAPLRDTLLTKTVLFELVMFFSIYRCWCDWHISVRGGSGGEECALRESLTEGKVLAWGVRQLDQQVIRRYAGAFDDLRVQFFHLKQVVRGNLQDADQRILYRFGHGTEAAIVVATFEHVDFCDRHLKSPVLKVTQSALSSHS